MALEKETSCRLALVPLLSGSSSSAAGLCFNPRTVTGRLITSNAQAVTNIEHRHIRKFPTASGEVFCVRWAESELESV